jgi:hypothetical protein
MDIDFRLSTHPRSWPAHPELDAPDLLRAAEISLDPMRDRPKSRTLLLGVEIEHCSEELELPEDAL